MRILFLIIACLLLAQPAFAQRYSPSFNGCRGGIISFYDAAGSNATWSSMPASLTCFRGQCPTSTRHVNTNGCTEVRVIAMTSTVAAAAGADLVLKYLTTYDATVANWLQLGQNADVEVALTATSTMLRSRWHTLAPAARNKDILVVLAGKDGDASASPTFGSIYMEFR